MVRVFSVLHFGKVLAFVAPMETKSEEEEDWQKLCALAAKESDPQRLSTLIDQLINKLDARRQARGQLRSTGGEK